MNRWAESNFPLAARHRRAVPKRIASRARRRLVLLRGAPLLAFAAACHDPAPSMRSPPAPRAGGDVAQRSAPLVANGGHKLVAEDSAEYDQFGYSVSLSGTRALVGAYGESSYRGAGYFFVRAGDTWRQEQKLVANDGGPDDKFGWSVALDADRALLGAYGVEDARGAAYVVKRTESEWVEEGRLVAERRTEYDNFGWSVALSDGRALIGAYATDDVRGTAYVFVRGAAGWEAERELVADDTLPGDQLGYSVALSADHALLGAPGSDAGRGAAYSFAREDGEWTLEQKLVASDAGAGDHFGIAVAVAGDRAIVGAYWNESLTGAAYVFARGPEGWRQEQKLVASDGMRGDRFGNSAAVLGDRALVGAFGNELTRGAAYVFARGDADWTEEGKLTASDGAQNDSFGWSVALGDGNALAGAQFDDSLRGAAYLFELGQANGQRCTAGTDCASGHCTDGICCNVACDGACSSCSIAGGATVEGRCTIFPAGSEGNPSCGSQACTGRSAECEPCQTDTDCPTELECDADGACRDDGSEGEACDASPTCKPAASCDASVSAPCDTGAESSSHADGGCALHSGPPADDAARWALCLWGLLVVARRRGARRGARAWHVGVSTCALVAACSNDPSANLDDAGVGAPPHGSGDVVDGGIEQADTCSGSRVTTQKRVVRLTRHQLFNAYAAVFGDAAASTITGGEEAPSPADREFPPIGGEVGVSEGLFALNDRLAQSAMRYVSENLATSTPCGAPSNDAACVQDYLLSLAETAFRHPLSDAEADALTGQLWDEMRDAGATLEQSLAYGVYAILSSPSFLYRTELGTGAAEDGPLSPHELATTVALFLTDRPPDAQLLAAAQSGELEDPGALREQVTRLLDSPEVRAHFESVLVSYFALDRVGSVILNADAVHGLSVTRGLLTSIAHEGELFLHNHLWSGALGDLLTSRQTWTSSQVATEIYGVAGPTDVDDSGFGPVALADDRAGLLTLSTFLTAGARSTGSSPVARGLTVNATLLCETNPPFPTTVDATTGQITADTNVSRAIAALADQSELEKAEYRAATPTCASCHTLFDAFGMVLEPYDAVGRHRSEDLEGRSIDESWTTVTLPSSAGGVTVTNARETARALVDSGALDRCLATRFIDYALTEVSQSHAQGAERGPSNCAVRAVLDAFERTDRSFASLIREIAVSETLRLRSKGH